MLLRLKSGVRLQSLKPQMLIALSAVQGVWEAAGAASLTITSADDGTHKGTSLHYRGLALDFRTKDLPPGIDPRRLAAMVKDCLGQHYDVILEDFEGNNEHLHVEYDPKSA